MDIASGFVSLVATIALAICMPSAAQCPPGWSLTEGIRITGPHVGEFACYAPLPACCGEPAGKVCERACPDVEIRRSRIHCTGGAHPIQMGDGRTVGCQR